MAKRVEKTKWLPSKMMERKMKKKKKKIRR